VMRGTHLAVAYRERKLSGVEELLISPDFAANFRGAEFVGLLGEDPAGRYEDYLANLKKGVYQAVLIVGDGAIAAEDLQPDLLAALHGCEFSAGMLADAEGGLFAALEVVFPGRSVLEKSGLMINRNKRLQYQGQVVNYPAGSEAEWRIISRMAERNGVRLTQAATYRDLSLEYLESDHRVSSMDLQEIKEGGGVDLRGVWKS